MLFTFRTFNNLDLPWKTECALNSLYWTYIFYHSGFLSNLRLPWKTELPWNLSLYGICTLCTFYHSGFLSNLRLPWKTELPSNFHCIEILFTIRIFEQLALALKIEFALKFFKPGGAASPPDPLPRTPMILILHCPFPLENSCVRPEYVDEVDVWLSDVYKYIDLSRLTSHSTRPVARY